MERIFLYYPTIDIPKKAWLYDVLLYTDKVSSILPNRDERHLTDSIKYLLHKDEYYPIYIDDVLSRYSKQFERYEDMFLEAIDDQRFFKRVSDARRDERFESIYYDKISYNLINELDRRKLIEKNRGERFEPKYNMIFMPENAAIYYMNILAQFVSEVDKSNNIIIPSTDYKRFSDLTFNNHNRRAEAINIVFQNCLPVPNINIPLSDIIDFKRKNREGLLRFRQFISKVVGTVNDARDAKDVNEILISTKEKVELELNKLNKIYSRNKIKTILTTMDSLFSLENPKLFESLLAVGLLSTPINPIIGASIAGISLTAKVISNHIENTENLKTNELNYLFEAKKAGAIK